MNVKCHCSAPPSQPPIANAFGQCNKSFCGIFAPRLGNARKICSPLPTITNSATVLIQWHKRTASGCSYTARATTTSVSSSPSPCAPPLATISTAASLIPNLPRNRSAAVPGGCREVAQAPTRRSEMREPTKFQNSAAYKITTRRTTNTPDPPSPPPCPARASPSTPSNISPVCTQSSSESAAAAAPHARAKADDHTSHNKAASADASPSPYPATRNNHPRTSPK